MLENISLAFQSIKSHKLRSFLTMLGIIIGIASIITIVSTIKGTNEQIKQSLIGSGNNAVRLRLCQDNSEYDLSWNPIPEGVVPITEDTRAELAGIEQVSDVSLYLTRPSTAPSSGRTRIISQPAASACGQAGSSRRRITPAAESSAFWI